MLSAIKIFFPNPIIKIAMPTTTLVLSIVKIFLSRNWFIIEVYLNKGPAIKCGKKVTNKI